MAFAQAPHQNNLRRPFEQDGPQTASPQHELFLLHPRFRIGHDTPEAGVGEAGVGGAFHAGAGAVAGAIHVAAHE